MPFLGRTMSDATCWTCPNFVYSGELNVGDCTYLDRMVKESSLCEHHPEYEEGDYVDVETDEE